MVTWSQRDIVITWPRLSSLVSSFADRSITVRRCTYAGALNGLWIRQLVSYSYNSFINGLLSSRASLSTSSSFTIMSRILIVLTSATHTLLGPGDPTVTNTIMIYDILCILIGHYYRVGSFLKQRTRTMSCRPTTPLTSLLLLGRTRRLTLVVSRYTRFLVLYHVTIW